MCLSVGLQLFRVTTIAKDQLEQVQSTVDAKANTLGLEFRRIMEFFMDREHAAAEEYKRIFFAWRTKYPK